MKKKTFALLLAVVMVMSFVVGGTLAWLTDTTGEVKNTFTTSGIDIELKETKTDFQMIPGHTIDKDPKVTVKANSEACMLFVEVTESENLDTYITYSVNKGTDGAPEWTQGTGADGNGVPTNVWFREVDDTDVDQGFYVLTGNKVTVNGTVEIKDMTAAETNKPTLTFKAYATQLYKDNTNKFTAKEAWDVLHPSTP